MSHGLRHQAADDEGKPGAELDAHCVDAQSGAEPLSREGVRDHRERAGAQGRFPDTDSHARQRQREETARDAAEGSHQAPDHDTQGNDVAPAEAVGQSAHGQPAQGVDQNEREARQQAHLSVRDVQVLLHRHHEKCQDLPVAVGKRVTDG